MKNGKFFGLETDIFKIKSIFNLNINFSFEKFNEIYKKSSILKILPSCRP